MRFRQQQSEAQAASRRLLLWFAVLVAALVVAVNAALAAVYKLVLGPFPFPAFFWATNTGVVLLLVVGGAWLEAERLRSGGGERVARWAGGRLLTDPRDLAERRLLNVVDEMAVASGLPRPAVYLLEREDGINAFVAGWTPQEAALAVTRGALQRLTRDELQGLVAHEFGHIREGDLPLNMRLLALVWGLSLVHGLGLELMQPDDEGRRPALSLVGGVLRAIGALGWLAGRVLQAAVSRQREHLADACAVQFTRSRDGLGNALRKVWFLQRGPQGRLASPHAEALAAMLLDDGQRRRWLATHPPLPERIRRITGRPAAPLPAPPLGATGDDEPWPRPAAAHAATLPVGALAATGQPLAPRCPSDPVRASTQEPAQAPGPGPHPGPASAGPASASVAPACAGPAMPLASRLDPYASRGDDAREAAERLLRLHGPVEHRAGLLACCLPLDRAARARAWQELAAGLPHAERIAQDAARLPPPLRMHVRAALLDRMRAAPAREARAARLGLRRLLAVEGDIRPLDGLRYACAMLKLRAAALPPPALPLHRPASPTPPIARTAPCAPPGRQPSAVASGTAPQWHGPWASWVRDAQDGNCARPLPRQAELHALRCHARGLRRLPMMDRPRVFKAWTAGTGGEAGRQPSLEVGWLLAELLDLPPPAGD